jgi:hypothetical protein
LYDIESAAAGSAAAETCAALYRRRPGVRAHALGAASKAAGIP